MNGLEREWASQLEQMKRTGNIFRWEFEPLKLRLAKATFYSPDFLVLDNEGRIELHECKGFMEDDAAVKIKTAAHMWPEFVFRLIRKRKKRDGGGLDVKVVGPAL